MAIGARPGLGTQHLCEAPGTFRVKRSDQNQVSEVVSLKMNQSYKTKTK